MMSIDNTPDSPAKRPNGCTHRGGNYWTLFTPGIWKVFHAVSQKRVLTEEQLKAVAENKDQQKALQRQRKVQYELDNKEKIDAQKDRAKAWAKQQRQKIAAKKKGNLDLRV